MTITLLTTLPILAAAALLEAGGDAVIRLGLRHHAPALLAAGAATLFLYGLVVNASSLDFGKLLGLYVVAFFLAAQLINLVLFRTSPDPPTLLAGALITAGGLVLAFSVRR